MEKITPNSMDNILNECILENNGFFKGFKKSIANDLVYNSTGTFDEVPLVAGSFNRLMKHINSGAPIMFISASTEKIKGESEEQMIDRNKRNTERLIEQVINDGFSFIKIKGHWVSYHTNKNDNENYADSPDADENDNGYYADSPEASLMVLGYNRKGKIIDFNLFLNKAIALRDQFKQKAVLVGKCIGVNDYDFKYYYDTGKIEKFTKVKIRNEYDVDFLIKKFNEDTSDIERFQGWSEYSKGRNIVFENIRVSKLKSGKLKEYENNLFNYDAK